MRPERKPGAWHTPDTGGWGMLTHTDHHDPAGSWNSSKEVAKKQEQDQGSQIRNSYEFVNLRGFILEMRVCSFSAQFPLDASK